MRPGFSRFGVSSAILVAAALLVLFERINGIRVPTADEFHVMAAASDPMVGNASRLLDICIGRFYAVIKWPVLEFLLHDCSDILLSVLRITAFGVCAVCAALFAKAASRDPRTAALVLVLTVLLLPVLVTYQPLFYNPLLWLGWAAIWMMGLWALKPVSGRNTMGMAGFFTIALMSHEMNAIFVLWPAIVRRVLGESDNRAGTGQQLAACGVVLLIYGAIAISLRLATADLGISYGGGTLSFEPLGAIAALLVNSLGILPGLELWLDPRWLYPEGLVLDGPMGFGERLMGNLNAITLMLALGAGGLAWGFLRSGHDADAESPKGRHLRIVTVLVFVLFAPNLLLSLTEKYQGWAFQRMWPYYYSWLSYQALVMIFVVGMDRLREQGPATKAKSALLALVTAWLVACTSASTRESTAFFREYRFSHSAIPAVPQEGNPQEAYED